MMSDQSGSQAADGHEEAMEGVNHANDETTEEQAATKSAQHGADSDISKILEELRRMQDKLSEVDERTQRDSRAAQQANFTTRTMAMMEEANSLLTGEKPARLTGLETMKQKVFARAISRDGDIDLLRRYMRFNRRSQEHRHIEESFMLQQFEIDLETYYRDLSARPGNAGPGQNVPVLESSIKPLLNQVEWRSFKACSQIPEAQSCVIDVLVGEPVLSDSNAAYYGTRGKTTGEMSKESAVPGQDPLPERIRIHSNILRSILTKLQGTPIGKPQGGPVVMVRPFKFLTFYQAQIQEWYDKVQNELTTTVGDLKSPNQGPLAIDSAEAKTSDTEKDEAGSGQPAIAMSAPETNPSSSTDAQPKTDHHSIDDQDQDKKPNPLRSQKASAHVHCLLEFVDSTISSKQKYLGEGCKKISFIDLWHLFKPGTEVIETGDKQMQCYRVIKVTSPKHKVAQKYDFWFPRSKGKAGTVVSVHCVYVDFDGRLLGPVSKKFDITRYEGMRDIKSLPVYPLRFEDNSDSIRQRLIDRGNKFLRVVQLGHMHYSGLTLESKDEVDSQVVIDFTEALAIREDHKNETWLPNIRLRAGTEAEKRKKHNDSDSDSDSSDDEDGDCEAECCAGEDVLDDNFVDARQSEQYLSDLLAGSDEEENPAPLAVIARALQKGKEMLVTDGDLVLMTYRVFGFVLRSRSWAKLDLAQLMDLDEYRRKREIENPSGENRNENAFDNLVFPNDGLDRKNIVRSLVAQHFRDRESATSREEQLDIVRGKGKGLIILLHGAPGVGKTTTAEGIAELFNKPLFQITCGDLGTTAKEVEAALETNFSLANKWGSILLLDEADVFLARRTPHDFQRNGLVAVFLRVLEYYAGILFLTTNRIGDFDEAFSSRIHISLHYPALDYNSTLDIFVLNWRLMKARFKHKGRALEIEESKITGFIAEYWHAHPNARWNGRQIRNACQTALALAEFEAQTSGDDRTVTNPFAKVYLAVSHMKTVSNAYLEFMKYLQDVRDADQERYAFLMGIRRQEGKDIPENPLAYGASTPVRRGQVSRLAEHRARSAARYNRPEQGLYPPSNPYANVQGDRPGHHPGSSGGGGVGSSPYQQFSRRPSGAGSSPYQPPPPEPQPQRGWTPGPVGGYYAGSQETQFQQGPPPGAEGFSGGHPYGQHMQP